jgi:hypothetical protein
MYETNEGLGVSSAVDVVEVILIPGMSVMVVLVVTLQSALGLGVGVFSAILWAASFQPCVSYSCFQDALQRIS